MRICRNCAPTSITEEQLARGVGFYREIIAQNERFTTLLKGWMRLRHLEGEDVVEAKRLIDVMRDTNLVAEEVISRATAHAERATEAPPLVLRIPIEEIVFVTAGIDEQIEIIAEDVQKLRHAAASPIATLMTAHIEQLAGDYRHAIPVVDAVHDQIRRWRKGKLTTLQKFRVAELRKRLVLLKSLLQDAHGCCMALKGKTVDALHHSRLEHHIRDLVEDA